MSVSLLELWLPILLSGLFAWIASALIHMVVKYHNTDYKKLNDEGGISDAIDKSGDAVGFYTLPHCADFNEMNDPAVQARFKKGPIAIVTVMENGLPPMGKLLTQQLIFFVLGSLLMGVIGCFALTKGAVPSEIFQLLFVVGFFGFGWASIPYSIWFGHPWKVTIKYLIDAIIYSVVIAATFTWLWPAAV
ncbi:hypothetical protein [Kangiella geojedonensis]|uniref:Uncharacterized protein n=1 Tax=Kangiella geojedonensis TaxID=914150 RepID=A0A0F6TR20_9GAMM|nr:hypothetical protein [Kangiella geojedonensis]AKE52177.1 hypothetical protein TQ33_1218 [Kangiella geojedonensis]